MVNFEQVLEAVSVTTGVPSEKVFGKDRHRDIMAARHLFCYMAKMHTDCTLMSIGKYINRDHTTVINSVKVVNDMIDTKYEVFVDLVHKCDAYINREFKKEYEMKVFVPYSVDIIVIKKFLDDMGCVVR